MKSIAISTLIVSAIALFSATAEAAPATLVGDTIDASINFTKNYGYGTGRVSGFGLDAPFVVSDSKSDMKTFADIFTLDVNGGSFTLKFLDCGHWLDGVVLKLTGLDFSNGGALTSVGVATNLTGYSLGVSAHEVDIKLGTADFSANSYLTGTFHVASVPTVSSVPEPSSFAMIGLGLGLVGFTARRRRGA